MNAPELSFTELNNLLRTASVSSTDAEATLFEHKDALIKAVDQEWVTKDTVKEPEKISYRRAAPSTKTHPEPTLSEIICLEAIEKHFGIGRQEAALLFRDFLEDAKGGGVSAFLGQSFTLEDVAPIMAIEDYKIMEKRNAFLTFNTVCAGASSRSSHPYKEVFLQFLIRNVETIKKTILHGAKRALSGIEKRAGNHLAVVGESWWCLELLFAYCLYDPLSLSDREQLLHTYLATLKRRAGAGIQTTEDSLGLTLDCGGVEATAFFAAAMNISNCLADVVHEDNEHMDMDTDERIENRSFSSEKDAITGVNKSLLSVREYQSAEIGMLSLSWAAFLTLRASDISEAGIWKTKDCEAKGTEEVFDAVGHMSFAMGRNVFSDLRNLTQVQLNADELVVGELYRCLWVDIVAFLTAFPPQNFTAKQVEDLVDLAVDLLSRTDHGTWVDAAESIWERENTNCAEKGANVLLRLASGVFPQTFRPLISLLSALTISQASAERAHQYLQNGLETLTEHGEAYQGMLLVLDPDNDFRALESFRADDISHYEAIMGALNCVCIDEDEVVYVQATEDIPSDVYRKEIKRGALGLSNTPMSTVTWLMEWNGFGAVNYILRFFLRLLQQHEGSSSQGVDMLSELLLSTLDCLRLIDRLCRFGADDLRAFLARDEERLYVISRIVAELLDPGDWARGSWLTKKRREVLLTSSASCVASMAIGSRSRARQALAYMSSAKNDLPLQNTLSVLGVKAFPSLAALSRVAELCSRKTILSDTLMERTANLSSSNSSRRASTSLQSILRDADVVYQFLRGVALPLWLTTSVSVDASPEGKSLHWLLPACSLHLFSQRPRDVLNDPSICSVIASVIIATAGSGSHYHRQTEVADTFLFPALRAALVSCFEALSYRNAVLQNRQEQKEILNSRNEESESSTDATVELTTMEKVFLKPDVIHAMALISSGRAVGLTRRKFFSMWALSEFKSFLPDIETERFLYWHGTERDVRAETVCSWKEWVQDMCARCLSLQFCCLSHFSKRGGIRQVPWPTIERTSPIFWRGGGQRIRVGYIDRIVNSHSVATIELLVTVLSCGQRAAARSLMGPLVGRAFGKDVGHVDLQQTSKEQSQSTKDVESRSRYDAIASSTEKSERSDTIHHDVLAAVVSLLRESRDEWVQILKRTHGQYKRGDRNILKELGQKSLLIAVCVRFLKVGWESHSSLWFRKGWAELKVWDLIASLLRCDGGPPGSSEKVDLAKALGSSEDALCVKETRNLSDKLQFSDIPNVVLKQSLMVDTISAWKSITADCLHMFAFEISMQISEALIATSPMSSQNDNSENSDQGEMRISSAVFQREPFTQFASVFTERWMHVLLKSDDVYIPAAVESGAEHPQDFEVNPVSPMSSEYDRFESIEERTRKVSFSLAKAIGLNNEQAKYCEILNEFRRVGDVKTRFGSNYEFDVPGVISFLEALEVNVFDNRRLVLELLLLNTELNRKDVQVEVITAFSEMASAVLFADSFVPNRNMALTYSSPQFSGKLCRFLSRMLVCMIPTIAKSSHTAAISSEISKLMASLSASLTNDELQHRALTSIRFPSPPAQAEKLCSLSPVGQICTSINRILESMQSKLEHSAMDRKMLDTARWLLLAVSRLVVGSSFRSAGDFHMVARCATNCLRVRNPLPNLFSAASIAVCSVPENQMDDKMADLSIDPCFDREATDDVFAAISALAREPGDKSWKMNCSLAASSLLFAIAHIQMIGGDASRTGESKILRHLSSGNILAFLPHSDDTIRTYDEERDSRNSAHLIWCGCLRVAGRVIPSGNSFWEGRADRDQILRDVLEFCGTNLLRISRDALDLSGDWPAGELSAGSGEEGHQHDQHSRRKYLSLGRIEEAEAGCFTIFKLASYGLQLQEDLPELLHNTVANLLQFTYQVYKIIRAEPIERSVRPVTQREKDRSQLWRGGREEAGVHASYVPSPLPWTASPSKSGGNTASTPPRRSPSQALRAAIGGSGGNLRGSPGGIIPPSPGGLTPLLHSPVIGSAPAQNGIHPSPGSPWGPYGSGIITEGELYFGEEASRSLLRALGFALGSLRRISDVADVLLFKPTMAIAGNDVGLGLLVALQYHACGEIYRGAQEPRRAYLQSIVDNALNLTMSHVMAYSESGLLTQGVKDEIRKRVATVRSRMQKVVPPAPVHSMVHAPELVEFLYQLKSSTN